MPENFPFKKPIIDVDDDGILTTLGQELEAAKLLTYKINGEYTNGCLEILIGPTEKLELMLKGQDRVMFSQGWLYFKTENDMAKFLLQI